MPQTRKPCAYGVFRELAIRLYGFRKKSTLAPFAFFAVKIFAVIHYRVLDKLHFITNSSHNSKVVNQF